MSKTPDGSRLLWAPWRIPYLRKITRASKPDGCFFCDYAGAPKKDRKNLVLLRGKTCFVVMNRFPYTGGHLLVAPYAHKGELALLSPAERAEIFEHLALNQSDSDRPIAELPEPRVQ